MRELLYTTLLIGGTAPLIGATGVNKLFFLLEAYSHVLVYWPLEDSETTISTTNVSSGKDVGEECMVELRNKKYTGIIAAKGT